MVTIRSGLCAASFTMIGMTAPAWAQSALCGGLGDGAPWMGQTEAASDIATAQSPLSWVGRVADGTRAVALFTLGAPMAVRVEAAADDLVGDPLVELFDATGRLVVVDDDAGGGLSARAEPLLEPGAYCVAMTGFGGFALQGQLQVSRLEMPALTPGLAGGFAGMEDAIPFVGIDPCLPQTPAKPLGQGVFDPQILGGLSATGTAEQASYFRFTLTSPQSISIRATNQEADPYIYLFDATGRLVAENDDAEGLDSRLDFLQPLDAGEYCVGLRALGDPTLPIQVSVSGNDARAAAAEAYATGDIAPPLDGSWPVEDLGLLPPQTTRDWQVPGETAQWFALEMPRPGLLLITADEISDSDPVISLFDSAGQLLGSNDDAHETTNSQLALDLLPGRYLLAVRQFDSSYKGMIRIGLSRYELAVR